MCNVLIKIASVFVLVAAIVFNFFGNLFGIGDIIPTEPKTTETVSVSESVTQPSEITTQEVTTETSTEEITHSPMTKPTSVMGTTDPNASTRPSTTREFGPRVVAAEQTDFVAFGGANTDSFTDIEATSDGGFVVCGVTASTDGVFKNVPDDSWSESYGYVAKFDENMNLVWIKAIGSDYASVRVEEVAVLSDGSVVAVGYSSAQDYVTDEENIGLLESFVVKYSSSGILLQKKLVGGKGTDMFMCVDTLGNGFVVGGKTNSTDGVFAGNTANGNSNGMILSFDADCNIKAVRYLAGNYGSCVDGVSTDVNGNVFITCITAASTGDFANIGMGKGYVDTAVFKYNSALERQWGFAVATSGRDNFKAVVADEKGGCVVAGNYELISTYVPDGTFENLHNCGGIDAVAVRINPDGTKRWETSVAGFSDDFINDVAMIENGGFALVGYTSSANRDFAAMGNKGQSDAFTAFVTPGGNLASVSGNGGSRKEMATCAAYTSEGELIVLGQSTSADGDFDGMNSHLSDSFITLFGDAFTTYMTKYRVEISE
ncbi:MAG: hypothetical protein IKM25_06675 [Clostridia bacterium]|nr:hypothetical protein [Clostridia bacterium]